MPFTKCTQVDSCSSYTTQTYSSLKIISWTKAAPVHDSKATIRTQASGSNKIKVIAIRTIFGCGDGFTKSAGILNKGIVKT